MHSDNSFQTKIRHILRIDRALALLWESAPGWTIVSTILIWIQGVLPLVLLYLTKLVVDTVTTGLTASDKGQVFTQVAWFIGLAGIVSLLNLLCHSLAEIASETQAQVVTDHVYDILHAKSVEVDLEYYENPQYYDTLHRAQQEAPYRPTIILNSLLQLGRDGISLIAMAALLLSFHWGITLILFIAVFPGAFVRLRYAGKLYRWQQERTSTERQSWYFNWLLTKDNHAKEIRLFGLGPLFIPRFRNLRQQLRQERLKLITRRSVMELIMQFSAMAAMFGSYAFIAYRAIQGSITLGDLIMYYQAFQRGQGFLRGMLSNLAGLYENSLFLSNLYDFLDLPQKVVEPSTPRPIPRPIHSGIVFEGVRFSYPTGTHCVLNDVNLSIGPGEKIALVGENGAGKTTLIKLLCRLYDPVCGSITIDGIDLREFFTTDLRREISVLFQDYAHYNLTARENIWFGNVNLPSDHEKIIHAAHRSGADKLINGLPHGYETMLGKWFEQGEELSIGEWQKVALARAFLREAQIIVLDEPTSSMDAKAEYEVFNKFRQLAQGQTAILISHRFSTVRMADRIYVLEKGGIVESGTHDELVRYGGSYAHLFETQAQYYK